jgi:hypothetical protein
MRSSQSPGGLPKPLQDPGSVTLADAGQIPTPISSSFNTRGAFPAAAIGKPARVW